MGRCWTCFGPEIKRQKKQNIDKNNNSNNNNNKKHDDEDNITIKIRLNHKKDMKNKNMEMKIR